MNSDNLAFGLPDNTFVGGATIGYAENASINLAVEKIEKEAGNPLRLVKTFLSKVTASFEADLNETHTENHILALGLQKGIIHDIEGSVIQTFWKTLIAGWDANHAYTSGQYLEPDTLTGYYYECTTSGTSDGSTEPTWPTTVGSTVTDGTAVWTCRAYPVETVTLGAFREGDLFYGQLAGYNIKLDADIVIYNSALDTIYDIDDDYWLDKAFGRVYIVPGGQIEIDAGVGGLNGTTIKALYKYTQITDKDIYLDPDTALIDDNDLEFIYTNRDTGEKIGFEYSSFQSDGNASMNMNDQPTTIKFKGDAQLDATNPDYEIGKITFYK